MRTLPTTARQAWALSLLMLLGLACSALWPASARAACTLGACVSAGPRLASLDSTRGALLNAITGNLLDSSINLTVADWNALAVGRIDLLKFAQALQAEVGASTPSTALAGNASLAQILSAAATAAQADGQTASASALSRSVAQVGPLSGVVRLGDMLSVSLPDNALATARLNALDLLTGSAQLYNTRNVLTTPTPIVLQGADLGLLGAGIGQVRLQAQAIEAPVYVCGGMGSTFHTASVRLKLDLTLLNLDIGASVLNGLGGLSGTSGQVSQLQLYIELARAEGMLAMIDNLARAVTVEAIPGVADIYLGTIADGVFFNRNHVIDPAADLSHAALGSLTLSLGILNPVTIAIEARAHTKGQAPSTRVLNFTGPYPQTRTATTSSSFVAKLLSDLLANLSLRLQPSLGSLVDGLLLTPLSGLVSTVIGPVLGNVLVSVVDPLLATTGARLGEVDVTVDGVARSCAVQGHVYNDANHNASREGSEAGCGVPLYAKLVPSLTPAGPASAVAAVDPSTGRYELSSIPGGNYQLLIDTNNSPIDVTANYPANWIGTEVPTFSRGLILGADTEPQNFGVFNGSRVVGTVFTDNGEGGGIAHDGIHQAPEKGLGGAAVRALNSVGAELDAITTGASGAYTLWLPMSALGAPVRITETNPAGFVSVQGMPGTTVGAYDRAADTITFTGAGGVGYSGVNFADVPDNALSDDGQQQILAGAIAYFPHTFTAGTAGQLKLSTTGIPGVPWMSDLYVDVNCNALLDSGDTPWGNPVDLVAGQKLCLLSRVSSPPNAAQGSQHSLTLTASYTYTVVGIVRTHSRGDTTVIGDEEGAGLKLIKSVDKASAQSGDVLVYTIRYTNQGKGPLASLKLNDTTPVYTVFDSAVCGAPLPNGITQCALTQQPAVGAFGGIEWTMQGQLQPGASGEVRFSVTVQ